MDALTKLLNEQLAKKPSQTVFESNLKEAFPTQGDEEKNRYERIREYARKNGYSVSIMNPGVRCTFRKLKK